MVRNRTVSADLGAEVKRLKAGVKIRLEKNDREPDFGFFETPIGTVRISVFVLIGLPTNNHLAKKLN